MDSGGDHNHGLFLVLFRLARDSNHPHGQAANSATEFLPTIVQTLMLAFVCNAFIRQLRNPWSL